VSKKAALAWRISKSVSLVIKRSLVQNFRPLSDHLEFILVDIASKTTEAKSVQTSTKDTSWICKRNALEMTTLAKGITSQAFE
jgi:hypothetical protein